MLIYNLAQLMCVKMYKLILIQESYELDTIIITPFYRWEKWNTQQLHTPKQWQSGILTKTVRLQIPCSSPLYIFPWGAVDKWSTACDYRVTTELVLNACEAIWQASITCKQVYNTGDIYVQIFFKCI